jgi:hypothetical protein
MLGSIEAVSAALVEARAEVAASLKRQAEILKMLKAEK